MLLEKFISQTIYLFIIDVRTVRGLRLLNASFQDFNAISRICKLLEIN